MRIPAALAVILLTSGTSLANVITIDDPEFGPNSVIVDRATRLEWLELKFTIGQSVGEVLSSAEFQTFTYASEGDFNQLGSDFFSPEGFFPSPITDLAKTEQFAVLLFGDPLSNPILSGFLGPVVHETATDLSACNAVFTLNGGAAQLIDEQCGVDGGASFHSSFLIREDAPPLVPEPSSLILLGTCGLFWAISAVHRLRRAWLERRVSGILAARGI